MNPIKEYVTGFMERGIYIPHKNSSISIINEEKIMESLNKVISDTLNSITHMPTISSINGILPIYNYVKCISFGCMGAIVCYKGIKMLCSPDEIDNKEGRTLFSRIAYSTAFSIVSIKFIDIMIEFANTLIKVLTSRFSISNLIPNFKGSGILLAILLLCVELFASIKILISFWMRMAELVFSGVISPVIFVLYINKEWSGFLKSWWKRVAILIFTQVAQVLLLIVYSAMINGLILSGSFNSMCLAIATLFLVDKTPKVLCGLIDNQNNVQAAMKKIKTTTTTVKNAKKSTQNVINKITKPGK